MEKISGKWVWNGDGKEIDALNDIKSCIGGGNI
jgi:hypothetical protein